MKNAIRNYTNTSLKPRRDVFVTVMKFLISFTAGTAVYGLAVLSAMAIGDITVGQTAEAGNAEEWGEFFHDVGEFLWEERVLLMTVIAPAIPTAFVYRRLPERSVDRYHKFGKAFAMFLTVNLTLSTLYLINHFHIQGNELTVMGFIFWFSVASAFLPGPYLGTYIAVRWHRD